MIRREKRLEEMAEDDDDREKQPTVKKQNQKR
jgi:hypothetical protein